MNKGILKNRMATLGIQPAQVAQMLAPNVGMDAHQLQRAIESDDAKSLSFLEKMAKDIADRNPQLARRLAQLSGVPYPFPGSR